MDFAKAIVQKIIEGGKHGPYAIATNDDFEGSITFSLEPSVWKEKAWPETGSVVYLSSISQKRAGWRANNGRNWNPSDEHTANKAVVMNKWEVIIQRIRAKFLPNKENKIWEQWVDYKERQMNDLIGLLSSDVKNGYKNRALFLLLVPNKEMNMIYWKTGVGYYYHKTDFLDALNELQLNYVADLIIGFSSVINPLHCDHPKRVVAGGSGLTIFLSIPDKYHSVLYFYNKCILKLLPLLSEEKQNEIFPYYSLLDISVYDNEEDSSGYHLFGHLLDDEKIDEKWKKAADDKMREIIENELSGKTKPREEWEEALGQYAKVLQNMLYDEINYSPQLFASQVQFVMDRRKGRNDLMTGSKLLKLFTFLQGEEYKTLRHTVARYVLIENEGAFSGFSIYNKDTQQVAELILEEFGNDLELIEIVREKKKGRDEAEAKSQTIQAKEKETEEAILAKMKK